MREKERQEKAGSNWHTFRETRGVLYLFKKPDDLEDWNPKIFTEAPTSR
jgi:hypothetical protein